MNFFDLARNSFEEIKRDRRYLHQIPEVGMDLPQTKAYVWQRLEEMGLNPFYVGPGICVLIEGQAETEDKKTILLRGDMDALPITEETDLDFKSTNGASHSCGHDIHTSVLLHTAKILNENKDKFSHVVKFMFQPAEEIIEGAKAMIDEGILENPRVDMAFALHVNPTDSIDTFGFCKGNMATSADIWRIDVEGLGGHGAYPHMAIDPIYPLEIIRNAINHVLSQEIDRQNHATITAGQLSVGDVFNVIPETAFMEGTIRTYSEEVRTYIKSRLDEIVKGAEYLTKAKIILTYRAGTPSLYSDPELTEKSVQILSKYMEARHFKFLASEDMSEISIRVPTCYMSVNCQVSENHNYQLHNPGLVFDEKSLINGVGMLCSLVAEIS